VCVCVCVCARVFVFTGLFNVGNKLLVSLDLFFKIRNHLGLGHDPTQAALSILQNVQNQPGSRTTRQHTHTHTSPPPTHTHTHTHPPTPPHPHTHTHTHTHTHIHTPSGPPAVHFSSSCKM